MINAIRNWFTKNFINLFGIIGIILLLFFGIYYVPHWIKEKKAAKISNAQKEVEQSVKELTFSDSAVNFLEIKFLIDAKEIQLNEKFPLSIPQVLTLTQQSFMDDNFLPLAKRKELIKKLENLKATVPKTSEEAAKEKDQGLETSVSIGAVLSIIISIIIALLAAFSLFRRQKKEEEIQEELNNEMEQTEIALTIQRHYAYEMESKFISVLNTIDGLNIIDRPENLFNGIGVHFLYKKKEYFVAFKFLTRSKIGLSTLRQIFYFVGEKQGEIWLFYNTDLTAMVRQEIKVLNHKYPEKVVRAIKVDSMEEFEKAIEKLLHTK